MSGEKNPPIIKKIIKKGHGGHHGGSWKVAYADFVTAMMAFFLVMWLLAISSEAGREALADYFNELTMSEAVFNGGLPSAFTEGGFKGPSVMEGGCFSPKNKGEATEETEETEADQAQLKALLQTTQQALENLESLPEGVDGGEGSGDEGLSDAEQQGTLSAGEQHFADALNEEVSGILGENSSGQVFTEKTKDGLRVQIVDTEGKPIFDLARPSLTPVAKEIIDAVMSRIENLPNKISIEGHTDATAFSGQRYTNWELSTARASATRIYLSSKGLPDSRLTSVAGYASSQPLENIAPQDPSNRRISIMIWTEEGVPLPSVPESPTSELKTEKATGKTKPSIPTRRPPLPKPGQRPTTIIPKGNVPLPVLEQQLIEDSIEKAATPDLSTAGPPPPVTPATSVGD